MKKAVNLSAGIFLPVAAVFAATACGGTTSSNNGGTETIPAGQSAPVSRKDTKFSPADIKVTKGTSVTWSNQDPVEHNATADNGAFNSDKMKNGVNFGYTFNEVGIYDYHCSLHPGMKGKVTVTE